MEEVEKVKGVRNRIETQAVNLFEELAQVRRLATAKINTQDINSDNEDSKEMVIDSDSSLFVSLKEKEETESGKIRKKEFHRFHRSLKWYEKSTVLWVFGISGVLVAGILAWFFSIFFHFFN